MQALVISQDKSITKRIRAMLQDRAWGCKDSVGTTVQDLNAVLPECKAELVIIVLPIPDLSESDVHQLRKQISTKMVVVGPADSKLILRYLHHFGADEYVDVDDLEAEIESVLRRSVRDAPGRVIAVMSPSGGGGATTLAVNLATIFAARVKHCALVDLNLSAGDAAAMLNIKPRHSLADYSRNARRMDRSLFQQLLTSHINGVELLAAPLAYEDIPDVTSDATHGAVSMARSMFPYVIADVDQSCSGEQIEVLKLADVILMVFRLDFVSLHNLRRVLDYFARCGISHSKIRLVANRFGQISEISPTQVESALNMKIDFYLPEDPKDVNRAENIGVPVVVDRPTTKISRSINELSTHLNGHN